MHLILPLLSSCAFTLTTQELNIASSMCALTKHDSIQDCDIYAAVGGKWRADWIYSLYGVCSRHHVTVTSFQIAISRSTPLTAVMSLLLPSKNKGATEVQGEISRCSASCISQSTAGLNGMRTKLAVWIGFKFISTQFSSCCICCSSFKRGMLNCNLFRQKHICTWFRISLSCKLLFYCKDSTSAGRKLLLCRVFSSLWCCSCWKIYTFFSCWWKSILKRKITVITFSFSCIKREYVASRRRAVTTLCDTAREFVQKLIISGITTMSEWSNFQSGSTPSLCAVWSRGKAQLSLDEFSGLTMGG